MNVRKSESPVVARRKAPILFLVIATLSLIGCVEPPPTPADEVSGTERVEPAPTPDDEVSDTLEGHGNEGTKLSPQGGGFVASCWDIYVDFPWGPHGVKVHLNATCGDGSGGSHFNTVALDHHLGVSDGNLLFNSGNYQDSCSPCGFVSWRRGMAAPYLCGNRYWGGSPPGWWMCDGGCRNKRGDLVCPTNAVDLDSCYANYNGILTYVC